MPTFRLFAIESAVALCAFGATVISGDARHGEELFTSEGCVQCHSVNGKGGRSAPDLGRRVDRNFTPTMMASLMWNHAPAMWSAMKSRGIVKAQLPESSAADLFAYFVSSRYFEKPGDAARGKQAFKARHCVECHGITMQLNVAGAKPVVQWTSLAEPIVLAQQMWNHAPLMRQAFARKGVPWQQLTSQELTDILVYLRNLPETKAISGGAQFSSKEEGGQLFVSKGCAKCHTGQLTLENRLRNASITDIAARMWNHAPNMGQSPPQLSADEMRQIVSYVWATQYFRGGGNPARGGKVFAEKNCASCHNNAASGAPNLAAKKGTYSDITMVSALWDHGPRMLERMQAQNLAWPRFDGTQMADLIAYLNSKP